MRPIFLALATILIPTGCGDILSSEGDAGLLRFKLHTDYEVAPSDLRDALIVARHPQRFEVELTSSGEDKVARPEDLSYALVGPGSPSAGTDTETSAPYDIILTAPGAGDYRLQARYEGEVIDGIDLTFDETASIELDVKVREPWGENFQDAGASPTQVTEGTQATFLPIPLAASGDRLAGDIETEVEATPRDAVVPGQSVVGVYENGIWTVSGGVDFYFIDPGAILVTFTETIGGATGSHAFDVVDASSP